MTLADIQRHVGVEPDGKWGPNTAAAIGKALGLTPVSTRKVLQAAKDIAHEFEGLSLKAYKDPGSANGLPITIGRGSTCDENGKPIRLGDVWTEAHADAVFDEQFDEFAKGVDAMLGTAPTTDNQFGAMCCLAYNIGLGALKSSTLLRLHKEGDYAGAAEQFKRWNKNDGREMAGLTRRRAAKSALYRRAA